MKCSLNCVFLIKIDWLNAYRRPIKLWRYCATARYCIKCFREVYKRFGESLNGWLSYIACHRHTVDELITRWQVSEAGADIPARWGRKKSSSPLSRVYHACPRLIGPTIGSCVKQVTNSWWLKWLKLGIRLKEPWIMACNEVITSGSRWLITSVG